VSLRDEALQLLRDASADVMQGYDIAPARRAEIETLFAQAMWCEHYSAQQLQQDCAAILPAHCAVIVARGVEINVEKNAEKNVEKGAEQREEYPHVILQLWQTRAPVVPTTKI
jgi:hypothetical protein